MNQHHVDGHQSSEALKKLQTVDKTKQLLYQKKDYDVRYAGVARWPETVGKKDRCRLYQAYVRIKCQNCKLNLCLVKERNVFKVSMRNKHLIEEHALEGLLVRKIRYIVTNSHLFSLRQ